MSLIVLLHFGTTFVCSIFSLSEPNVLLNTCTFNWSVGCRLDDYDMNTKGNHFGLLHVSNLPLPPMNATALLTLQRISTMIIHCFSKLLVLHHEQWLFFSNIFLKMILCPGVFGKNCELIGVIFPKTKICIWVLGKSSEHIDTCCDAERRYKRSIITTRFLITWVHCNTFLSGGSPQVRRGCG